MEQDDEVIAALLRARSAAMEHTAKARIPECSKFGEIAQDLDWAIGELLAVRKGTPQWQPIETAPRDGTKLLVLGGPYLGYVLPVVVDAVFDEGAWWPNQSDWMDGPLEPTHWMPLPPPPEDV